MYCCKSFANTCNSLTDWDNIEGEGPLAYIILVHVLLHCTTNRFYFSKRVLYFHARWLHKPCCKSIDNNVSPRMVFRSGYCMGQHQRRQCQNGPEVVRCVVRRERDEGCQARRQRWRQEGRQGGTRGAVLVCVCVLPVGTREFGGVKLGGKGGAKKLTVGTREFGGVKLGGKGGAKKAVKEVRFAVLVCVELARARGLKDVQCFSKAEKGENGSQL